jgi:AraC-like DNA-binding protein
MPSLSIVHTLLFVGAAQGLLLAIALFSLSRGNRTANRILAVLLFLFSMMIFFHTLAEGSGAADQDPGPLHHGEVWFFLFGPLFYLYVRALTERTFKLRLKAGVHLLPFHIALAVALVAAVVRLDPSVTGLLGGGMMWLMVGQVAIYMYLVLRLLRRHKENIQDQFSSLERVNLRWLWFVTIGFLVIWPAAFLVEIFKRSPEDWNAIWLLISVFMYLIGYMSIRQPAIFGGEPEGDESPAGEEKKKYEKSSLSDEDGLALFQRLEESMSSERPYLESNLTLPELAKRLGVSVHHLSQIINQRLGQNFFEYVNAYRIREAKRLLEDPAMDHLTIAAIGFEAGFNSVSSFNTVFKKTSRSTPSQYRATRRSQNASLT